MSRCKGFENTKIEVDNPKKIVIEILKIDHKISYYRIAKELYIHPSNINYYLNGDTKSISLMTAQNLYDKFGIIYKPHKKDLNL